LAFGQGAQKLADARPGDLRVFAGTSMRGPLESVLPAAEKRLGKTIVVEYGAARGALHDEIMAGQAYEVAILLPDTNQELIQKGKAKPGTYDLAVAPIGLGLRGQAPAHIDVSTEAGIKALLLGARSVKYTPTGAAITTVQTIFQRLEIGGAVKDSSRLSAEVPLGPGEYEIAFYPVPEIASNHGLRNLGAVIAPLQSPAIFQAVIGVAANDAKAARAFAQFLQSPALAAGLTKAGLTRPR
jgi:molybdate transport system substrate-binding protein